MPEEAPAAAPEEHLDVSGGPAVSAGQNLKDFWNSILRADDAPKARRSPHVCAKTGLVAEARRHTR